jgi:glycosyltransferase involved in cell wall biosynthesis
MSAIVSSENGTCEIITHGENGFILEDPQNATGLPDLIRRLFEDASLRQAMGENGAHTARQLTWERNRQELATIFHEILARKTKSGSHAELSTP